MLQTINNKKMLKSTTYDLTKKTALIYLPALGTLYAALAVIWNLPASDKVTVTVLAVDTFLGLVLRRSAKNYDISGAAYDGQIEIGQNESGTPVYTLPTKEEFASWANNASINLKIVPAPPTEPTTTQMDFDDPPQPPRRPPVPPTK